MLETPTGAIRTRRGVDLTSEIRASATDYAPILARAVPYICGMI